MLPLGGKPAAPVWPWNSPKGSSDSVPRKSLWTPLPDSLKSYPTPADLTGNVAYSKAAFPPLPASAPPAKDLAKGANFDISAEKPCKETDIRPQTSYSVERYMYDFFTQKCTGACPGISCLSTHRSERIRRKPLRLPSGYFSYTNVRCKRENCASEHCPFAHTSEEVLYHPEQYKCARCAYQLSATGVCAGNGVHCPFAHNASELRPVALFNALNETEAKPDFSSAEVQETWAKKFEPKRPVASLDILTYKTLPCKRTLCKAALCHCYHSAFDKRRNPSRFSYLSVPCKYAFDLAQRKFTRPDKCPQGETCHFAHTKYESYYHPQFYKTQICSYYATSGVCKRGSLCAYKHSADERAQSGSSLETLSAIIASNQALAKETGSLKCQVEAMKCTIKLLLGKIACPVCTTGEKGVFLTCGHSVCTECRQKMRGKCLQCAKTVEVVGALRL